MKTTLPSPPRYVLKFIALMLVAIPSLATASTPITRSSDHLHVFTDPGQLPVLETQVRGETLKLPLQHTHVDVEITAGVARVEVTQSYKNPYQRPIEALYTFPLPMNSAVDRMQMVIGDRTIEAQIKESQQARRIYEAAKQKGHTASLLEQERPNIFSQSVANIAPGTDIDIVVSYVQSITYANNQWEFVFPMVVGPRFVPPGHADGPGTESYKRLRPLVLGHGQRPGNDISMNVTVFAGSDIHSFDVPTHDVVGNSQEDGSLRLSLDRHDRIPNRDFILHYKTASTRPQASVLAHRENQDGHFALTVMPPLPNQKDQTLNKREFTFVVDISGSMNGVPLAMCKDAMREALGQVRADDTFNVLTFAGQTKKAFARPRRASEHNIKEAISIIDGLKAGGGTMMAGAITEALNPNNETNRERYVFFLTDGYVGNEKQIFERTKYFIQSLAEHGQEARVFGFGVGSSVNRHLLDGLSSAGRGITYYASTRQDPAAGVREFFRTLEQPILSNIKLKFEGVNVSHLEPQLVPDLLAGRPLEILGQFQSPGQGKLHIHGTLNGQPHTMTIPLVLPSMSLHHSALKTRWARARLKSLNRQTWNGTSNELKTQITELGLRYGLVTPYTSFVAVDSSTRVQGGQPMTIEQPGHIPEGVNPQTAGNRRYRGPQNMLLRKSSQTQSKRPQISPLRGAQKEVFLKQQGHNMAPVAEKSAEECRREYHHNTKGDRAVRYFLQTQGALNRTSVIKSLKKAWEAAPKCMIQVLFNPEKAGQRLEITVNGHGRVVSITIVGPRNHKNNDYCVRSFFEQISFPKAVSGASTRLILDLKSLSKL